MTKRPLFYDDSMKEVFHGDTKSATPTHACMSALKNVRYLENLIYRNLHIGPAMPTTTDDFSHSN